MRLSVTFLTIRFITGIFSLNLFFLIFNSPMPWRVLIPSFQILSSFCLLVLFTPFYLGQTFPKSLTFQLGSDWLRLTQLDSAWLSLTQLGSAWLSISLSCLANCLIAKKQSFILSGVFSLKVVTFSSNPFENVNEATRFSRPFLM